MCAGAISHARLRRLYYAAPDPKGGAVEHGPRFFRKPPACTRPKSTAASAKRSGGDAEGVFRRQARVRREARLAAVPASPVSKLGRDVARNQGWK